MSPARDWSIVKIFWKAGTRLSVMLFSKPHRAKHATSIANTPMRFPFGKDSSNSFFSAMGSSF